MDTFCFLYNSLQQRPRPEDLLTVIQNSLQLLTEDEQKIFEQVNKPLKKIPNYSYMATDFQRPIAPIKQIRKASELFTTAFVMTEQDCTEVAKINQLLSLLSNEINKVQGCNNFLTDRLSRTERKESLTEDISKRRYNKLFRFLSRLENKLATYQFELRKYDAMRIAKSGLATFIGKDDFNASLDAARFIAYYSARANRRSIFTNKSQDRAFDTVCALLLKRFEQNPNQLGWKSIAQIMPDYNIVQRLTDENKLQLFTLYLTKLYEIADLLELTWQKSRFNRATMIVMQGDDSSTWNALAGAWNKLREGWLAFIDILGMQDIIEQFCLGKVMRVMAADVAYWHRATGGTLEPDTLIWAELPMPWQVLKGQKECGQQLVIRTCQKHGVNPFTKGWVTARTNRTAVPFTPTPELVHGVVVNQPELALLMRKWGFFLGKS